MVYHWAHSFYLGTPLCLISCVEKNPKLFARFPIVEDCHWKVYTADWQNQTGSIFGLRRHEQQLGLRYELHMVRIWIGILLSMWACTPFTFPAMLLPLPQHWPLQSITFHTVHKHVTYISYPAKREVHCSSCMSGFSPLSPPSQIKARFPPTQKVTIYKISK